MYWKTRKRGLGTQRRKNGRSLPCVVDLGALREVHLDRRCARGFEGANSLGGGVDLHHHVLVLLGGGLLRRDGSRLGLALGLLVAVNELVENLAALNGFPAMSGLKEAAPGSRGMDEEGLA